MADLCMGRVENAMTSDCPTAAPVSSIVLPPGLADPKSCHHADAARRDAAAEAAMESLRMLLIILMNQIEVRHQIKRSQSSMQSPSSLS